MKKPNLFIIGEPKSGTTSIYYYLKDHPDIGMSSYKEPKFFATDLREESDNYHGKKAYFPVRTLEDYLELFKGLESKKIVGEASTQYLYSKAAAKNIYDFNHESKIIAIFREPLDFLFSSYREWVVRVYEDASDFFTALSLEESRKNAKNLPRRVTAPSYLYYSELPKYTQQLKRYYKYFPKNRVKVIIFDDLKNSPAKAYNEIMAFLGLKPDKNFNPEVYNYNKQIRLKLLVRLLKSPAMLSFLRPIIPKGFIGKVDDLFNTIFYTIAERPSLDDKKKRELMKKLKPGVVDFSEMLGRDLVNEWGYDKV